MLPAPVDTERRKPESVFRRFVYRTFTLFMPGWKRTGHIEWHNGIPYGMPVHHTQILTIDRIKANPAPIGTGFLLR